MTAGLIKQLHIWHRLGTFAMLACLHFITAPNVTPGNTAVTETDLNWIAKGVGVSKLASPRDAGAVWAMAGVLPPFTSA